MFVKQQLSEVLELYNFLSSNIILCRQKNIDRAATVGWGLVNKVSWHIEEGKKINSGIGLSYPPTNHVAWRAGTTILCRSWLYPPVRDLWIRLLKWCSTGEHGAKPMQGGTRGKQFLLELYCTIVESAVCLFKWKCVLHSCKCSIWACGDLYFQHLCWTFYKNGKNDSKKVTQHKFDKSLKHENFATDFFG